MAFENNTVVGAADISVIIPTYNRADILNKTLQAYAEQDAYARIREVLVVDDGSIDHTRSVVEQKARSCRVPLRYLHQENSGLAAARNHAIREARSELMLFGDDDIIPGRSMVGEHLAWHLEYREPTVGVLGLVAWAPEIRATPFMEWAGLYGPQFQFGFFKSGMELDFRNAYFCNTSLKSGFLKNKPLFDENFRAYGWEDIEFSYRLYKEGWRLRYNPGAIGYHHKFETFDQSLHRMEQVWKKSWPVYLRTESGRHYDSLRRAQSEQPSLDNKPRLTRIVSRAKVAAAHLLKPLMDTRFKLPARCYDFAWYHHCKPIMDAAFAQRESVHKGTALEGARPGEVKE
jgi:GT2 family glycosyltransferase